MDVEAGRVDDATARLLVQAVIAVRRGRAEEGVRWTSKALARRPDYPYALHEHGVTLYQAGQTAAAVAAYRSALRRAPSGSMRPRYDRVARQ